MTDDSGHEGPPGVEDGDDMELERLLRDTIGRADPMPPGLPRYAREAYTLGRLDAELAELTWDSWVDRSALTRDGGTRLLTFTPAASPATRLHVEVVRGEHGFELAGRVEPPSWSRIRVAYRGGSTERPIDSRGRFTADIPPVASIRFLLPGDELALRTGWVPIG